MITKGPSSRCVSLKNGLTLAVGDLEMAFDVF